jgi:hypothetical protein
MHRKALIAIAVGSILGGAAYAAGEQPAPTSSPDSQAPPASVTGVNGQPVTASMDSPSHPRIRLKLPPNRPRKWRL